MHDRKWICSASEEYWDCPKEFATREEAIAYAITNLATERRLEEGRRVYTGEVRHLSADDLSLDKLDKQRVLRAIDGLLCGCFGSDFDYEMTASEKQQRELVARLISAARSWFAEHKLPAKAWIIQHVRSHIWETQNSIRIPKDQ